MTVYTRDGLMELLSIGPDKAYEIMQQFGFRTGYQKKSPYRITEEGVKAWVEEMKKSTASQKTPSNG